MSSLASASTKHCQVYASNPTEKARCEALAVNEAYNGACAKHGTTDQQVANCKEYYRKLCAAQPSTPDDIIMCIVEVSEQQ